MVALAIGALVVGAAGGVGFLAYRKRHSPVALAKAQRSTSRSSPRSSPSSGTTVVDLDAIARARAGLATWDQARADLDNLPLEGAELGFELGAKFGPIGAAIGLAVGAFVGAAARILGLTDGPRTVGGKLRELARSELRRSGAEPTRAAVEFFMHGVVLLNLDPSFRVGFRDGDLFVSYPSGNPKDDHWKNFCNDWLFRPCFTFAQRTESGSPRNERRQNPPRPGTAFGDTGWTTLTRWYPRRGAWKLEPTLGFWDAKWTATGAELVEDSGPGLSAMPDSGAGVRWGEPKKLGRELIAHLAETEAAWHV